MSDLVVGKVSFLLDIESVVKAKAPCEIRKGQKGIQVACWTH